jgi:hypothetical protein
MTSSAPRLPLRLLKELDRLEDRRLPMAEVSRRLGRRADRLGLPQPSYETVRAILAPRRRRPPEPTTTDVVVDVMLGSRPPEALLDQLSGIGVPRRSR